MLIWARDISLHMSLLCQPGRASQYPFAFQLQFRPRVMKVRSSSIVNVWQSLLKRDAQAFPTLPRSWDGASGIAAS